MRNTGNFNLEWGYLAPAPSFLRSVRLVVVAATIAATASAAVVFALVRQPAAEASVAARTLAPPVEVASAPKVPVAAELQTQSEHASTPDAQHAAGATRRRKRACRRASGHHFFRRWRFRHRFNNAARASRCRCGRDVQSYGASIAKDAEQEGPRGGAGKGSRARSFAAARCVGAERGQTDSAAAGAQCRTQ